MAGERARFNIIIIVVIHSRGQSGAMSSGSGSVKRGGEPVASGPGKEPAEGRGRALEHLAGDPLEWFLFSRQLMDFVNLFRELQPGPPLRELADARLEPAAHLINDLFE